MLFEVSLRYVQFDMGWKSPCPNAVTRGDGERDWIPKCGAIFFPDGFCLVLMLSMIRGTER